MYTNFAKKYSSKATKPVTKPYKKDVVVKKPRVIHSWSDYQSNIFSWIKYVAINGVSTTGKKHLFQIVEHT